MHESMRMATPVPGVVPREAVQDHMLGNVPITKGTILDNDGFGSQHSTVYFKDPMTFRPERWES
jgi:cytochrome P450